MSTVMPLVIGPIALLLGMLAVVFRRRIRDATVSSEKSVFGRRVGEQAEKLQSAFWVGFTGVIAVLIGVAMIGNGLYRLVSGG